MESPAWINLPHARTIAERLERQLEILRALDGEGSFELNRAVLSLRRKLDAFTEDPDIETAEREAAHLANLARDVVRAIVACDRARGDRLGQCVRNLFECLGSPDEGRKVSLVCGEDPNSLMR